MIKPEARSSPRLSQRCSSMKKYYFSDDNEIDDNPQDIEGDNFVSLLKTCLQYCTSFSVDIVNFSGNTTSAQITALKDFEIPDMSWNEYQAIWKYFEFHPEQRCCTRYFYHYHQQTFPIIKALFPSLFSSPKADAFSTVENLTFFRPDMTIFLRIETHEGEAFLFAKEEEDISCVLSGSPWKEMPITTIGYVTNADMPWKNS